MLLIGASRAASMMAGPGWSIHAVAEPTDFSVADAQDVTEEVIVQATEGAYRLRLRDGLTGPIAWDASAEEMQKALEMLSGVGSGNVAVTGGPGDQGGTKPYMIKWIGVLSGNLPGVLEVEEADVKDAGGAGSVRSEPAKIPPPPRDRYAVSVVNVGSQPSQGNIVIADKLPQGIVPVGEPEVIEPVSQQTGEECSLVKLKCVYSHSVLPGRELVFTVRVAVASVALTGKLLDEATVSEMVGTEVSTKAATYTENPVNAGPAPFGIMGFTFGEYDDAGVLDLQSGDHPYNVTTTIELNSMLELAGSPQVVQDVKDVSVELPLGFAGDPMATERCPEIDLTQSEGTLDTPGYHPLCPDGSQIGTISLTWAGGFHTVPYPVYNVVPDSGYPAELGFNAGLGQPIFLYGSVVRGPSGYRLRIAAPGALRVIGQEPEGIRTTVFGDPGAVNGTGGKSAFVTSPTDCMGGPVTVNSYITSWEGGEANAETIAYPDLTGCNLLQGAAAFDPNLSVEPETTQADTPSGYVVDLKIPQAANNFGALATPDLKDATITLPPGVSVSPAAANGPAALAGCEATGKQGINIGSSDVAPDGQDLGDPEATELGEGHPGSKNEDSPYDDGLWHIEPGHCPKNSRLGEVEAKTPDLTEPLHGHMYLAEPRCGGSGQLACTEAMAEEGKVFAVYLEVSGSGVIVKQPGTVDVGGYGAYSREAGLLPGQVRVRFRDAPQFPLEEVRVTFPGGQRTPLANPQTCGTATTTSELEPWSAPESGPNATRSSSFAVTDCGSPMAFKPGFSAGTVTPIAGGFSPFVLQLSRQDGEQDLSGLETTFPDGLLAKLAGVPECGDAEAATGSCPSGSQIGTVTVTLGSGSEPLTQTGRVYLTGPYNGGPFGVVVVVPAVAGPFNLGNVVVRGSIRAEPDTAQASIVSDPFPQLVDGVPVRIKTVDVEVNRPGFTFNPTDCDAKAVTGTLTATQGASVPVSSPFAVTGCANLPFKPSFKASTRAKTSRVNGASLVVKVAQKPGEANIHTVRLRFPKALPARLATLRLACTEAQFAANPAGCPAGSVIGTGTAVTPVLPVPLSGPAYLVSHGGAAYPDVVFVLQGDNVRIDLTGHTSIKKAVTYSSFETVPDAPVTSFETVLPEGPHAIFGANLPPKAKGSFCGRAPTIDITSHGQNGAPLTQNIKVKVTGCPKHVKHHKHAAGGGKKGTRRG